MRMVCLGMTMFIFIESINYTKSRVAKLNRVFDFFDKISYEIYITYNVLILSSLSVLF